MIFCGDVNTVPNPIDLARPQSNQKSTGFLPGERAWMDKVVAAGYVDTFRHFHPDLAEQYTRWYKSQRTTQAQFLSWHFDQTL